MFETGNVEQGIKMLQTIVEDDKKCLDTQALNNLATVYVKSKEFDAVNLLNLLEEDGLEDSFIAAVKPGLH